MEKQRKIMEKVQKTDCESCLKYGDHKELQACVETLESQNHYLESMKVELERKNLNLETTLNDLNRKCKESEELLAKEKQGKFYLTRFFF